MSQATKLIIEGKKAVAVEYLRDGKPQRVRAAREIVLCGGVVDSPKLLMLSGIGQGLTLGPVVQRFTRRPRRFTTEDEAERF